MAKPAAPSLKKTEGEITEEIISKWYPSFFNSADTTDTDEKKAADWVLTRQKSMAKARETYETEWNEAVSAWSAAPGQADAENTWKSTHTVPLTHGLCETAIAEMVDANPDDIISERSGKNEEAGEKMHSIFKFTQWKGDFNFQKQVLFRDMVILGTVIWEEYYREDKRIIKEIIDVDPETGETTYEIKETTDFNDVYGQVRSVWDIYVDENAEDFSDAVDCVRREVIRWDDFTRLYAKYKPVEMGVKKKAGESIGNESAVTPGGDTKQQMEDTKPEGDEVDKVEIFHYYNKPEDIYWIVANGTLVNSFNDAIPFWHKELPFARGVFILRSHKFYGIGMPTILKGAQSELDTLRRMALDRAKLNISKVFLTSARENLTDEDLAISPGKRIEVADTIKSVVPLEFSDTGASRYSEEDRLIDDARYATGVSNPSQAITTGATATESAIVKEATLKRIRGVLELNSTILFTRLGRLRVQNIQQFYKDPVKVEKVIGSDGFEAFEAQYRDVRAEKDGIVNYFSVDPAWVRGEFDYSIQSYSTVPLSQALDEQRADQMYDRLTANQFVDQKKLASYLARKHSERPETFLMDNLNVPDSKLAYEESLKMMGGAEMPPTQGATPEHTQSHIDFIERYAFQIEDKVDEMMTTHIQGEIQPTMLPGGGNQPMGPIPPDGLQSGVDASMQGMPGEMPPGIGAGEIPGMEGGGNPMIPDLSADQQLGAPGQSIMG
jgi:hypothetical protein